MSHDPDVKSLGIVVAVAAVAAAWWLHFGLKSRTLLDVQVAPGHAQFTRRGTYAVPTELVYLHKRALWQDPIAAIVFVTGLGAGVVLVHHGRRASATR